MVNHLQQYNAKRNFDKTDEPAGDPPSAAQASPSGRVGLGRFVVQHHIASREHYDFRLEHSGTLKSWAVPKGPSLNPLDKRLAMQVEDHPLGYRDFEGTIPKGQYGGGTVMLWDEGTYEALEFGEDSIKIELHGQRLRGKWALVRMKSNQDNSWLLIKEKDSESRNAAGISQYKTSIRTGRTMEEITLGTTHVNPFWQADIQLCKLMKNIPTEEGWLYELKYDGWRVLSYIEAGKAKLITRNGNDYTKKFRPVANALVKLAGGRSFVFDGEMMLHHDPLQYIIFDLLALDGKDLRDVPLLERKEMLDELLADAPDILQYSLHIEGHGAELFAQACAAGLEGIVGKRADSLYTGRREWIKVKCENYSRKQESDNMVEGVAITNPDKIFSEEPKITKLDLALYYQQAAPRMLPYVENRIISAIRCPGGSSAPCFFKKHPGADSQGISTIETGKHTYYYIKDSFGLISELQMNTVEFHAWGSRVEHLEQPDVMVFDLDPDEGMELAQVRQGARDLKKILDGLNLKSYLKTSGGKGYHVYIPMKPAEHWTTFRDTAKSIADIMVAKWPERYTGNVRKVNRKDKIFVDWLRNTRGATSVAPYSVRIRPGMPVSCPIAWNELNKIAPNGIDMAEAIKRTKRKDPWEGFFEV